MQGSDGEPGRPLSSDGAPRSRPRRAGALRQTRLGRAEILLGVDADGRLVGLRHADGDPVLEKPQLLQSFDTFELALRCRVEHLEGGRGVRVESQVLEVGDATPAVAVVRDRVTREIERPSTQVADDLHGVRARHFGGRGADLQRAHRGNVQGTTGRHHFVGVRRHEHLREQLRAPRRGVHVRDQRPADELAQDLAREPGGRESRRDDAQDARHGKLRTVRRIEGRGSGSGAKGTMTGCRTPASTYCWTRSRQNSTGPTTPRPSRNRSDTPLTAPLRSPALHAALMAVTSSGYPAERKNAAYESTMA